MVPAIARFLFTLSFQEIPNILLCHLWCAASSFFVNVADNGHSSALYKRIDRTIASYSLVLTFSAYTKIKFIFDLFQRKRPESAGLMSMKSRSQASTSNSNDNDTFASNRSLTGEEIRILRRAREEHSRRGGWVRIFPTASSWDTYRSDLVQI